MDMRNDIATTLVAVTSAFIGSKYWVYADPVGAISVWYVTIDRDLKGGKQRGQ